MHELAIAQQIREAILGEMGRWRARAASTVDVEVGRIEGLRAEDVRRAFEFEVAGTPLEGTQLRVTITEGRGVRVLRAKLVLSEA